MAVRPMPPDGEVRTSTWASRAWTYQEGYLAKRLLIFTNRIVLYICNTYPCEPDYNDWKVRLSLKGFFPSDVPEPSRVPTGEWSAQAFSYMQEYSRRDLSYDEDGLNAILGALNTLSNVANPAHHLWGVPLGAETFMSFDPHTVWTGLAWFRAVPGHRRTQFPSWTSIGWVGPIYYYTPRVCHRLHIGIQVGIKTGDAVVPLHTYISSGLITHHSGHKDAPRLLQIIARALTLAITHVDWPPNDDPSSDLINGLHVVLPASDTIVAYALLQNDDKAFELDPQSTYTGLVLSSGNLEIIVLVLVLRDAIYERIGIFRYNRCTPTALFGQNPYSLIPKRSCDGVLRYRTGEILHKYRSMADSKARRNPLWLQTAAKQTYVIGKSVGAGLGGEFCWQQVYNGLHGL